MSQFRAATQQDCEGDHTHLCRSGPRNIELPPSAEYSLDVATSPTQTDCCYAMDAFERLVTVNRFNSPEPVATVFPLGRAIDRRWCEETSRALMGDRKWEILEASPSLSEHLPEKAGLYMFVWRIPFPFPTDRLGNHTFRLVVYVGQAGGGDSANSIRQRYKQEYSTLVHSEPQSLWNHDTPDRGSKLSRFLNLPTLEFWFHEYGEQDLIMTFEDYLIKLLNPPGNSQLAERNPAALRGNIGRAIPAF